MLRSHDHPMHVNTNTRTRWNVLRKLDFIQHVAGKSVLDLASGMGYFSLRLKENGAAVLATDIHEASLAFIREHCDIPVQRLNIEADAYPEGRFDVVLLCEVLEHVKNPGAVIAKASACLKPGGTLLVTTPALEGALIHSAGKELGHHHGAEKHERDGFSQQELTDLLLAGGLHVEGHRYSIFYLTELFMQLTKLVYLRKSKQYEGQSDILSATKSMPYKVLRTVYPFLNAVFDVEELLLRGLKCKGHCHIMWGRRHE